MTGGGDRDVAIARGAAEADPKNDNAGEACKRAVLRHRLRAAMAEGAAGLLGLHMPVASGAQDKHGRIVAACA